MAYGFNGTDQYVIGANSVATYPFTLYAKFFQDDKTRGALVSIDAPSVSSPFPRFCILSGKDPGDGLATINARTATTNTETTLAAYALSTWQNMIGLFVAENSRAGALNGGNYTTSATSVGAHGTLTNIGIGRMNVGASGQFFAKALIAESAVWNVADLSLAEIASLAKGFSPRRIRPQSLVFHAPLIRNLQDVRRGRALTPVNGPTVAAHPRCYA